MAQQAAAASTPPAFTSSSGSSSPSQHGTPPALAIQMQAHHQHRAEQVSAALTRAASAPGSAAPPPAAPPQGGGRRRRWYLGIQSKKEPAHVMTEVYKALQQLGCEWRILDSYRIKCRWRVATDARAQHKGFTHNPLGAAAGVAGGGAPIWIKISLTLYKVQASIYLLDFQKTDGNPFDFMTLCARIITELKALSQQSRQNQQMAQQQAQLQAQAQVQAQAQAQAQQMAMHTTPTMQGQGQGGNMVPPVPGQMPPGQGGGY